MGIRPVIYKLDVHPTHRGKGLRLRRIEALVKQLPAEAKQVYAEHFASNVRAGAFYRREGFVVARIDSDPGGVSALDTVWRVRKPAGEHPGPH